MARRCVFGIGVARFETEVLAACEVTVLKALEADIIVIIMIIIIIIIIIITVPSVRLDVCTKLLRLIDQGDQSLTSLTCYDIASSVLVI